LEGGHHDFVNDYAGHGPKKDGKYWAGRSWKAWRFQPLVCMLYNLNLKVT